MRGGVWVVKIVIDGKRVEERLGSADDDGAPESALSYPSAVVAALEWSKRQVAAFEGKAGAEGSSPIPSVRAVIEDYSTRRHRMAPSGRCSAAHLLKHLPADSPLGRAKLPHLTSKLIDEWLDGLKPAYAKAVRTVGAEPRLSVGSLNCLLSDLRAALNAAIEKYRRQIPSYIAAEVKVGTRVRSKEPGDLEGGRMQLLTDDQVRDLVDAAFGIDQDFGYLVLIAASSGARYSQIARLVVADVQVQRARIMMPGSRKGRKRSQRAPAAVPISPEVLERLTPLLAGRHSQDTLLMRWVMKRTGGAERWMKDKRRPWGAAYDVKYLWEKTVAAAGAPDDTIMYALRHSSIVRGLIAGLPVRVVAALHDTSIRMIEDHYSAYILDMTEDLARRHAIAMAAPSNFQVSL